MSRLALDVSQVLCHVTSVSIASVIPCYLEHTASFISVPMPPHV